MKTATIDDDFLVASATAASSALRKVSALAQSAPRRNIFAAISTLTELSSRIETSMAEAGAAIDDKDNGRAELALARSTALAGQLAAESRIEEPQQPAYLRKRRIHFDI